MRPFASTTETREYIDGLKKQVRDRERERCGFSVSLFLMSCRVQSGKFKHFNEKKIWNSFALATNLSLFPCATHRRVWVFAQMTCAQHFTSFSGRCRGREREGEGEWDWQTNMIFMMPALLWLVCSGLNWTLHFPCALLLHRHSRHTRINLIDVTILSKNSTVLDVAWRCSFGLVFVPI